MSLRLSFYYDTDDSDNELGCVLLHTLHSAKEKIQARLARMMIRGVLFYSVISLHGICSMLQVRTTFSVTSKKKKAKSTTKTYSVSIYAVKFSCLLFGL